MNYLFPLFWKGYYSCQGQRNSEDPELDGNAYEMFKHRKKALIIRANNFQLNEEPKQDASELWRLILHRFLNRGIKWMVYEFPCSSSSKWNTTDRISANNKSRKEAHIKYYSHNFYLIWLANQTKGLATDRAWLLWTHWIPG